MIARIQQALVLALAASVLTALLVFAALGFPWLGVAMALLLASVHLLVLAAEFAMAWKVAPKDARPKISLLLGALSQEAVAAAATFYWRQPFKSRQIPDRMPSDGEVRRGVVLVHGLGCNRGFWNPWMRELSDRGHPFLATDFGRAFGSIDRYADEVAAAVARLSQATGMVPVVVAHSLGGLAVRQWLSQQPAEYRLHRVITIGTPHRGTWMARFTRSTSGRQMTIGSDWLRSLGSRERTGAHDNFTCFIAGCDNVVFPVATAGLPGAANRLIPGAAHVALAFDRVVFEETLRWLQ